MHKTRVTGTDEAGQIKGAFTDEPIKVIRQLLQWGYATVEVDGSPLPRLHADAYCGCTDCGGCGYTAETAEDIGERIIEVCWCVHGRLADLATTDDVEWVDGLMDDAR